LDHFYLKKFFSLFISRCYIYKLLTAHAADHCPVTPPHVKRVHWGFDDPAKAEGTEEEKWAFFQRVRDEVGDRIHRFAETGE
jgi:arsenate reductase